MQNISISFPSYSYWLFVAILYILGTLVFFEYVLEKRTLSDYLSSTPKSIAPHLRDHAEEDILSSLFPTEKKHNLEQDPRYLALRKELRDDLRHRRMVVVYEKIVQYILNALSAPKDKQFIEHIKKDISQYLLFDTLFLECMHASVVYETLHPFFLRFSFLDEEEDLLYDFFSALYKSPKSLKDMEFLLHLADLPTTDEAMKDAIGKIYSLLNLSECLPQWEMLDEKYIIHELECYFQRLKQVFPEIKVYFNKNHYLKDKKSKSDLLHEVFVDDFYQLVSTLIQKTFWEDRDFMALELLLLYFGFLFKFLKQEQDYVLSDVTKMVIHCIECKIDQAFENKRQEMVSKLQNRDAGEKKKKESVISSPEKEPLQTKPVENKIDPAIDEVFVSISLSDPVFLSRLRRSYIKHTGIHHSLLEDRPNKEEVMNVLGENAIPITYPEEKVSKTVEENLPLTIEVPSFAKEQKKDDVLLQRFDKLLDFWGSEEEINELCSLCKEVGFSFSELFSEEKFIDNLRSVSLANQRLMSLFVRKLKNFYLYGVVKGVASVMWQGYFKMDIGSYRVLFQTWVNGYILLSGIISHAEYEKLFREYKVF